MYSCHAGQLANCGVTGATLLVVLLVVVEVVEAAAVVVVAELVAVFAF